MKQTENLKLSQYEAEDTTSYLTNYNDDMKKIDDGVTELGNKFGEYDQKIAEVKDQNETIIASADDALSSARDAITAAEANSERVSEMGEKVDSFQSQISGKADSKRVEELASETGNALSVAQRAEETANAARATANGYQTQIADAVSKAESAVADVKDAKAAADRALTTSGDAKQTAQDAQTVASGYSTSIAEANTTAQAAETKADTAVQTANSAKTEVENLQDVVDGNTDSINNLTKYFQIDASSDSTEHFRAWLSKCTQKAAETGTNLGHKILVTGFTLIKETDQISKDLLSIIGYKPEGIMIYESDSSSNPKGCVKIMRSQPNNTTIQGYSVITFSCNDGAENPDISRDAISFGTTDTYLRKTDAAGYQPKGNYATTDQLTKYATTAAMNSTLTGYATTAAMNSALASYATTAAMNSALTGYKTVESFNSDIANYLLKSTFNSSIAQYPTKSSVDSTYMKKSNIKFISNNKEEVSKYVSISSSLNHLTITSKTAGFFLVFGKFTGSAEAQNPSVLPYTMADANLNFYSLISLDNTYKTICLACLCVTGNTLFNALTIVGTLTLQYASALIILK